MEKREGEGRKEREPVTSAMSRASSREAFSVRAVSLNWRSSSRDASRSPAMAASIARRSRTTGSSGSNSPPAPAALCCSAFSSTQSSACERIEYA